MSKSVNRDTVVGIFTRFGPEVLGLRNPAGARDFPFSIPFHTGHGAQAA